ncbi:hypothetical protein ACFFNY_29105 [Paenibacillus hodogayensis]|uniref:Uncharacterized protein n=1 Tax=Paenibacillus hodogayensis TaxID=279208 RepID=A0ABV5W508_9BACL
MSTELDHIIQEESSGNRPVSYATNPIANVLHTLGVGILIVGIIAGVFIIAALEDPGSTRSFSPDPHPLRWVYGVTLIISSLFSGMVFVGFGETIKLLTRIKENTET